MSRRLGARAAVEWQRRVVVLAAGHGAGLAERRSVPSYPYAIVLAGGEGRRLASVTRALYGVDRPKQFAVLVGERSLLQATLDRARLTTTDDRIMVVVTAHQEPLAREQLAAYPAVELVVQPRNLDTGPGLLLPLVRIVARDPGADVVVLPSDHYVRNALPLVAGITTALAMGARITLLAVRPTGPEEEYGWIVRGTRLLDGFEIAAFVEKPDRARAHDLWKHGAMWNTFISAGPVAAYWAEARAHLPAHAARLERFAAAIGSPDEAAALTAAFIDMPAASFSRDVLAHSSALAVLPIAGTGWSDWGDPQRVFASLAGTPEHSRLVDRMRTSDHVSRTTKIACGR